MAAPDLVTTFLARLQAAGIRYMVTGSVASTIYGEPRFTQDIDLVLSVSSDEAPRLVAVFPASEFYVPPLEVITDEGARPSGGHFNLLHLETGLRADCHLAGNVELYNWGLDDRRAIMLGETRIWVAAPEYVIVAKLEFRHAGGGSKHLEDIATMLRISGDLIDRSVIAEWAARLALTREWQDALAVGRS